MSYSLLKNFRKKDNLIQKLQSKDRQREDFLKRSADEVNRLRQQARQASWMSNLYVRIFLMMRNIRITLAQ